jgi:hypothetical protein
VGERTNRIEKPEKLEHDVEKIRATLTEVVGELDRRRHALMDWRLQVREHKGLLAGLGAGVLLLLGTSVGVKLWRARHQPPEPLFRRRLPPVQQESVGHKVVAAGAAALVAVATKALAQRAVGWVEDASHA